jgi:glycine/D-amino acid oxidase-like deaminating enzyme
MSRAGPERLVFSGWIDPPADPLPALDGERECDVVVVGGGYTGMAAALRLRERGADVVVLESAFCGWVLESAFCGWGASSRNAGHLTPTIAGDPQLLASAYRRRAPELVRLANAAVHFTAGLIERLGIECEYVPGGNVSAALSSGQMRRAGRIARFLARCGGEVELVEGRDAGLPHGFRGGILERAGGTLNPGLLARGLRAAVRDSGASVFERTAVRAIEPGRSGIVVEAAGGRARAERVVLATNAYTRDLGFGPPRVVAPLWVTLAETEPIEPGRLEAAGWVGRAGIYTQHVILESYRRTARGTVVFGSRLPQPPRGPLGARSPDPGVVADIVRGFHERFPSLRDVAPDRAWGGWIAMTPSWLPVAGGAAENVFYAVGYNGHGLAQAPYLGTLLADRLAGEEAHDDLRAVWRPRPRFAPAPLFSAAALRAGWAIDRISDRLAQRE